MAVLYQSFAVDEDPCLLCGSYCISRFAVDEDRGLLHGRTVSVVLPLTKTVDFCMAVLYQSFGD